MEQAYKNYKDLICDSGKFNNRIQTERRQRLPFVDSHTGIAQRDCALWHTEDDRLQPNRTDSTKAKLFYYPAHRWHKSRREYLLGCDFPSGNGSASRLTPSSMSTASSSSSSMFGGQRSCTGKQYQINPGNTSVSDASCDADLETPKSTRNESHTLDHAHPLSVGHQNDTDSNSNEHSNRARESSVSSPYEQTGEGDSFRAECDEASHKEGEADGCKTNGPKQSNKSQVLTRSSLKDRIKDIRLKRGNGINRNSLSILVNGSSRKTGNGLVDMPKRATDGEKNSQDTENSNQLAKQNGDTFETLSPLVKANRPFVCSICDQSYKTRPGLSYHFIHKHNMILPKNKRPVDKSDQTRVAKRKHRKKEKLEQPVTTSRVLRNSKPTETESNNSSHTKSMGNLCLTSDYTLTDCSLHSDDKNLTQEMDADMYHKIANSEDGDEHVINDDSDGTDIAASPLEENQTESTKVIKNELTKVNLDENHRVEIDLNDKPRQDANLADSKSPKKQNLFCDFCLGTAERNRRTRLPEGLISCSSCGSSGHPSCLQFSDNVRASVKKYDWQCIDCKTCSTCNKADNEDQLLFCDDCDKSFHTYCLSPPLKSLPEGNWSCNSCIADFGRQE